MLSLRRISTKRPPSSPILKLINYSSRLNKGNDDDDVILIARFNLSVFHSVLVSIKTLCQTLQTGLTIFPNISKFVKNTPLFVAFSTLFCCLIKHALSCNIKHKLTRRIPNTPIILTSVWLLLVSKGLISEPAVFMSRMLLSNSAG